MSSSNYLEINLSQIQNLDISGNTKISGPIIADNSLNIITDLSSTKIQIQNVAGNQYTNISTSGIGYTGVLMPQSTNVISGVNSSSNAYTVNQTEMSYLSGVSSSIQNQFVDINSNLVLKAPIFNPTFTGTVGGITKSMVGLGDVDNTSDANKPISTATQTALNLRAFDASCVHLTGDETIAGNKTFTGTNLIGTNIRAGNYVISGGSIQAGFGIYFPGTNLNRKIVLYPVTSGECGNHSIGVNDLGKSFQFMVPANDSTYRFSYGTSASTKSDYITIDSTGVNVRVGNLLLNGVAYDNNLVHLTGNETIAGNKTFTGTTSGITSAMVGLGNVDNTSDANKPISTAAQTAINLRAFDASCVHLTGNETIAGNKTFTGTTSGITKTMVGLGNVDNTSDANKPISTATQTALNLRAFDASCVHLTGAEIIAGNKTFSNSIAVGGATNINTDGSIYLPNTVSNRKIVLYNNANNEFQNLSIGVQSGTMQFMVGSSSDGYTFSYGTSSTAKADYVRIDASGVNARTGNFLLNGVAYDSNLVHRTGAETVAGNKTFSNSISVGGATISTDGALYFTNAFGNRKIVLYSDANNDFQNMSLGVQLNTFQFMVPGNWSGYTFSYGSGIDIKNDYVRIDNSGINIVIGNLRLNGVLYDNNLVHLTGNETIAGNKTFTGTTSGITSTMVGLGNVDNTSDASKPISTATQTALNLRAFDASCVHLTGNETIAGNKTFSNSIAVGGATIDTSGSIYLPNSYTNRKIVLNRSANNEFQNVSIGIQPNTMQFIVGTNTDGYTFSYATSSTAKADMVRIDTNGVNVKTGNLLLNGVAYDSNLVHRTGVETVAGNKTFSNSISVGGAAINTNGSIYLPNTMTNRKIVLYAVGNNEFQNYSIGIQSGTIQFMVDSNTSGYTFSCGINSTTKVDYVRIDNNGINIITGNLRLNGVLYDNNLVHLTGNETIGGNKTFSGTTSGITSAMVGLGNVDNTSDANKPISTAAQTEFNLRAFDASCVHLSGDEIIDGNKTFSGTTSGITKTMVGLGNVDNTSDANKPISTATQTAINLRALDTSVVHLTGNETIAGNKTFSGTTSGITKTMVGLGNVDNTSDANKPISTAAQTAINLRALDNSVVHLTGDETIAGNKTFTGTTAGITKTMVGLGNVDDTSDIDKPISSAVQSELTLRAYDNSVVHLTGNETIGGNKTFSGTTTGITKTMVGLGNVDNTSDANKPISTATQTALNARAFDASCVHLTGAETVAGDKTFSGNIGCANLTASSSVMCGNMKFTGSSIQTGFGIYFPNTNLNRKIVLFSVSSGECGNHSIGVNDLGKSFQFMVPANDSTYRFSYGTSASTKSDYTTIDSTGVNIRVGNLLLNGVAYDNNLVHLTGDETIGGNKTFSGTTSGITKTMVGLGDVDNTSDANKPISTATQTALNERAFDASCVHLTGDEIVGGNKTFTGTISGISATMVGLGNVENTSDANKPVSTATQSALDLKAPLNNPTFTGTVGGITASMVGLGNVDNTSDVNKPISTATQSALILRAYDASCVHLTGAETIAGNKTFSGNIIGNSIRSASSTNSFSFTPTSSYFYRCNFQLRNPNNIAVFQYYPEYGTSSTQDNISIYNVVFRTGKIVLTDQSNVEVSTAQLSYLSSTTSNIQTQLNLRAYDASCVHLAGAETISGNKTFSNSIAVGGATINTDKSLYFSNDIFNRKIVFWTASNNDYQNYSIGMQVNTLQFMVPDGGSGFAFSYGTGTTTMSDYVRINNNGLDIKTGNLLLNGTNILTRSNVWGSNTNTVNTFTSSTPTDPVLKVELTGTNLLVYKDSVVNGTALVNNGSGVLQIGSMTGITGFTGPIRTELRCFGIFMALYGSLFRSQTANAGEYIATFKDANNSNRISIYDEGGGRARPQIEGESGAGIEITCPYGVYITSKSNDAFLRKIVLEATSGVEVLGANGLSAVAFRATSDIRLKTNIIPLEPQLDKIKSLTPYSFTWKEDNRNDYGFIAQDVFKKYPIMNFTSHKEDEPVDNSGNPIYHSFDYSKLTTILWKGLQETVQQVEIQQTQIKSLEETIQTQQHQIEQLQKQIQILFDKIK